MPASHRVLPAIVLALSVVVFPIARSACPALATSPREEREIDPLVLENLERFQDLKFGLFIHWGIYSQWGCIESWPLVKADTWARPDDLKAWTERDKDFERFSRDYRALNRTFNPGHFEPQKWAGAAKDAGMRYLVFTTKHHDGFCMFDTRQTDYRTTHPSCPFHKSPQADVAKVLFDTFRREGFRIGAYYSKSDWHHPGYWAPEWPHPDRNVNYDTSEHPEKWAGFVRYTHALVEEIVTRYGPIDVLWLDGGQVRPPKQDIDMPKLAAMARRHQPGLIVVDRTVGGRYENYRTPEQKVPDVPPPYVWETCMTMGGQWSYKPDDDYKSTRELIQLLVDIVAKGGNFLLNVGPDAEGRLPEPALKRLAEIGDWMDVNSAAIYATRPIAPYKVGQTCLTRKGNILYLIHLAAQDENAPPSEIRVPALTAAKSVRMLGVAEAVKWTATDDGLTIQIPEAARSQPPCDHAWAFEVRGYELRGG